jgi:hypothetical protein
LIGIARSLVTTKRFVSLISSRDSTFAVSAHSITALVTEVSARVGLVRAFDHSP